MRALGVAVFALVSLALLIGGASSVYDAAFVIDRGDVVANEYGDQRWNSAAQLRRESLVLGLFMGACGLWMGYLTAASAREFWPSARTSEAPCRTPPATP